ncbi:MAG: SusE domain-containing protein [Bacteroidetes bacterium]|nr:SusE domain-containing protein [Bacteroidota bacterium]
MKTRFLKFLLIGAAFCLVNACTKDEARDTFVGSTAPALTASVSSTIPLAYATADQEAVKLSWTNPNYQFASGVSSQDVSYLIEIDTTGANFTNPSRQTVSLSKDLSVSFTQAQLNDYLLNQLQLKAGIAHNLDIRVTASLAAAATKVVSNVLKFTVTPYAIPPKVAVPSSGDLFLVGSATAGGWNNPVPVPSQKFTKISATLYEITVPLTGGQEYLFLPVNGDWSHKYAVKDKTLAGLADGGDFGYDKNDNFPGPATSGTYKISVDFQRGKFTVTKQ